MASETPVAAEAQPLPLAKAAERHRRAGVAKAKAYYAEKRKGKKAKAKADAAVGGDLMAERAAIEAELQQQATAIGPADGPRRPVDWAPTFLRIFAVTGSRAKAAKAAGVTMRDVRKREEQDADFVEGLADATTELCERLQDILLDQATKRNNALSVFGLLKRYDPSNWTEKLQVEGRMRHTVEKPPMPDHEIKALIGQMLLDMSPELKRQYIAAGYPMPALPQGEVIDAEPAEFVDIVRTDENGRRVAYDTDGKPVGYAGGATPVQRQQQPVLDPEMAALADRFGGQR